MKKIATFIILLTLAGCTSSERFDGYRVLQFDIEDLKSMAEISDRAIGDLQTQVGYLREIPENARLKQRIRIMDETFSRDLRGFREKLLDIERIIATQAALIKILEDKQPIIELDLLSPPIIEPDLLSPKESNNSER